MNWWKRWFGLHPVEMLVHFSIGGFLIAAVGTASRNDTAALLATAAVLAAYAWRRHRAVTALPPAGSVSGEVRAAELEAQAEELHDLRGRVAELEERLDFAERLLARQGELPRLEG